MTAKTTGQYMTRYATPTNKINATGNAHEFQKLSNTSSYHDYLMAIWRTGVIHTKTDAGRSTLTLLQAAAIAWLTFPG